MSYKCLECKDKGVYEGLNVVEPCKSCSGSTSQEYYIETTRGTIKSLDFEIEKDFTMYDDMSSSIDIMTPSASGFFPINWEDIRLVANGSLHKDYETPLSLLSDGSFLFYNQ